MASSNSRVLFTALVSSVKNGEIRHLLPEAERSHVSASLAGSGARHQNLVHPPPVHVHNFNLPAVPIKLVTRTGDASQHCHDKAADGLIIAVFFVRQGFDLEFFFEFVGRQFTVHQK